MPHGGRGDLWDRDTTGLTQLGRRLSSTPAALARLRRLLLAEPALAGRLEALTPAPIASGSLFFAGRWRDAPGVGGAGGTSGSPDGSPVLVKLNCSPWDRFWLPALSALPAPGDPEALGPAVFAAGDSLGGAPLRWVVLERLPHRLNVFPAAARWDMLAETAARFQAAAPRVALPDPPPDPPVVSLVGEAAVRGLVEGGLRAGAPAAARRLLDRLDADWAWLERACPPALNWGDLHPGNALCRTAPPARGRAVLIDPLVRAGPWAFDAAYLQSNVGAAARLVERTARWRARLGLPVGAPADLERVAALLLGWLSASWWPAPWLPGLPPRGTPEGAAAVPGGGVWLAQASRYIEAAVG